MCCLIKDLSLLFYYSKYYTIHMGFNTLFWLPISMHTLIDNSQTITHWIYYHTTAKLYDFIKWVFNFYVLLGNPYILNWFSKEAPRLIIHTRTSAVMQMGVKFKTTNNFDFFSPCLVPKQKSTSKMVWKIFAPISYEKNPANIVL